MASATMNKATPSAASEASGGATSTICPTSVGREWDANWWDAWTFGWVQPLVKLGYRRPLLHTDLGSLGAPDHPALSVDSFDAAWKAEVERAKHVHATKTQGGAASGTHRGRAMSQQGVDGGAGTSSGGVRPDWAAHVSLWRVLLRSVGARLWCVTIYVVFGDLLGFVPPIALDAMLSTLRVHSSTTPTHKLV